MTGPDPHVGIDLGAHVLGLLDEQQAKAVEAHLAGCEACRREWEELREMTELLGEMPPEAFLDGPPDGDLMLQRTLRQVRSETSAHRRRRVLGVVGAAAVAVAVVLGGGVVVGRATAPGPAATQAAGAFTLEGTGPDGVAMKATVGPAGNWVRLAATVSGIPAGQRCRLMVIGKDGSREVAGSWVVSAAGEERGVTLEGSAAVSGSDVAGVAVENEAGHEFVELPV